MITYFILRIEYDISIGKEILKLDKIFYTFEKINYKFFYNFSLIRKKYFENANLIQPALLAVVARDSDSHNRISGDYSRQNKFAIELFCLKYYATELCGCG